MALSYDADTRLVDGSSLTLRIVSPSKGVTNVAISGLSCLIRTETGASPPARLESPKSRMGPALGLEWSTASTGRRIDPILPKESVARTTTSMTPLGNDGGRAARSLLHRLSWRRAAS